MIDLSKEEVRVLMKEKHRGFRRDNMVVNQQFNYLKIRLIPLGIDAAHRGDRDELFYHGYTVRRFHNLDQLVA